MLPAYFIAITDSQNLEPLNNGFSGYEEAAGPAIDAPRDTLILAGNRTKRPDILRGFRRYHDGWNITNRHYWAVSSEELEYKSDLGSA